MGLGYVFCSYNPSILGNTIFTAIMFISLVIHLVQMVYYKSSKRIFIYGEQFSLIGSARCSYIFTTGDALALFFQCLGGALVPVLLQESTWKALALLHTGLSTGVFVIVSFTMVLAYFLWSLRFLRDQSQMEFSNNALAYAS